MKTKNKLLLLLSSTLLIYGCESSNVSNSINENFSSQTSVDISSTESIELQSSQDKDSNSSIIESSSVESSSFEESSSFDSSTVIEEPSSFESSSMYELSTEVESSTVIDSSTTVDSSNEVVQGEEQNFIINSSNYTNYKDIIYDKVAINDKYSDELEISPSGKITIGDFDYLTKVVIHLYGTYDNLVISSNANDNIKWSNKETLGEGNKTSVKYVYDLDGASSLIISNPSTYKVNAYSITVYYKGETTIDLPEEQGYDPIETTVGWTNEDYGTYYSSINTTLTGTELLGQLRTLNSKKRTRTVGYSALWSYYSQTDYDPKNPSKYIAFYQGTSASQNEMNKEHVWPDSRGGNLVEGDLHMTRPTLSKDNSNRGNSFYVEGKNSTTSGWDPATAGLNPIYRGISARIIFYCVIASNQLSLVDTENDATSSKTMGKLSDLLKWNLMYPVDYTEFNRNEGAQKIQGNRNPFIDNTSFACAIWGNTNANTKKICSGQVVETNNNNNSNNNEDNQEVELDNPNPPVSGSYVQIKSKEELDSTSDYIIVAKYNNSAAGTFNTKYLSSVTVDIAADTIYSLPSEVLVFNIKPNDGHYNFVCNNEKLGATSAKNLSFGSGEFNWDITFNDNGDATIASVNSSYGIIKYNPTSSGLRFLNYGSSSNGMVAVQLFKKV